MTGTQRGSEELDQHDLFARTLATYSISTLCCCQLLPYIYIPTTENNVSFIMSSYLYTQQTEFSVYSSATCFLLSIRCQLRWCRRRAPPDHGIDRTSAYVVWRPDAVVVLVPVGVIAVVVEV